MFLTRFISYLQYEKRFSPHTFGAYREDIQQYSDFLSQSEINLADATHFHVRSWMVELLDNGMSPKSVARKLSSLRSFYKFLLREGLASHNPLMQVKAPKIPRKLPVFVEEEKLNLLLDDPGVFAGDFTGLRDKLVMEMLFGTGMRLAELVSVREGSVDFHAETIKVLGKRNKERIIPVDKSLVNLISLYISEKKKQQFNNNSLTLLVTNKGLDIYPGLVYRIVKKYLSSISTHQKKSPHVLRHTYATSLLNHGADINAIKELLGHASLAATEIYTHNSVDRLKLIYKQAHPKA
ncbi:tyrosine-type recombinase/integrase [Hufsiella ginkgonis]|uniref:Tyrosine recombinase XerC n=1 Tax=Hufsiella ginkgonis TaxID=2695274 RepID=A0A7K1Y3K1_9SPHI|nr:tyrosine-type recombinase/integrase [Hufsiella ginkgonis]MXV17864.1 tyrosine-type recombinase/integrase [Hufsiella ginkgonis]